MRTDKFTSKFQMALSDAQSMALGLDNNYIEPEHVIKALLEQDGGSAKPLLSKAGVNIPKLNQMVGSALENMAKVTVLVAKYTYPQP